MFDAVAGIAAAQWLSLRLQLLAAAVITFVAALGIASTAEMLPAFASYHHRWHLSPDCHVTAACVHASLLYSLSHLEQPYKDQVLHTLYRRSTSCA